MALPALRQPKLSTSSPNLPRKQISTQDNYVILTLRNENKLVVTSDAYNGIITEGEMYKCVFCGTVMELQSDLKEIHKNSHRHKTKMNEIPYVDSLAENLIRMLSKDSSYCTLCKVSIQTHCISRHTATEVHQDELNKAVLRAMSYTPS